MDELRKEFDRMYDEFLKKQNFIIRRTVSAKREEIWDYFNDAVRPYYEEAIMWRALQAKMGENKCTDTNNWQSSG